MHQTMLLESCLILWLHAIQTLPHPAMLGATLILAILTPYLYLQHPCGGVWPRWPLEALPSG